MKCNRRHGDRPFLIYTSLMFGVLNWEKRQWGSKNISWWRMDRDRSHFGKEKYFNEEKSEIYIGLEYDWYELCNKLFPPKDPLPFHLLSRSLVPNSWKFTNSLEQRSIFAFYFFLSNSSVDVPCIYWHHTKYHKKLQKYQEHSLITWTHRRLEKNYVK